MEGRKISDMALAPDDQYQPYMSDAERLRVDKVKVSRIKSPDTAKMMKVAMGDKLNTVYYTDNPKKYAELLERRARFQESLKQGTMLVNVNISE